MTTALKVLILEDSPNDILLLLRELRRNDFEVDHIAVSNADDMRAALRDHKWDIILSDYSMGSFDALAALQIVKEFGVDIPFIITSGTVGEDTAVAAMKAGASDFFAKDKLTRLIPAVERELREAAGRRKRGEAEARFTTVFHTSPVGTIISRLSDGRVLDVNSRLLTNYGYSRDDIVGHNSSELDLWMIPGQSQQITQQLYDTGSVRSLEIEYKLKSGRKGYALMSAEIIDLNNEPCVLTMVHDITDRKEAEQAREYYAERLELLHSIDLAILRADEPQIIAETVLTRLQTSMHFDSASIINIDLSKSQFTELAAIAPIADFAPYLDESIINLLQNNEVYYVDDLTNAVQLFPSDKVLLTAGIRSYVRIPLLSNGKLLGAFSLCAKEPHAFLIQELNIAKEVGSQLAIVIENARLSEVEQRRNSELAALHQASLQLTNSLDVEKILDTVVDYAITLIHAHDAHIFLYDGEKLTFGAAQWDGEKRDKPLAEPRQQGLTYTVAQSGKRLAISDVNQNPVYEDWKWGGAIIGLPLRVADEVNGVMSLAINQPHQFDEHEIRLLELLADQAAIAIHNAQLYQQVRSHAKELEQRVFERTEQLQSATDRVVAILNNSSDSVILADSQGLIQQTNPGFNRQFGYEHDALFGQPLTSVVTKESIDQLYESLQLIEKNTEPKRIEVVAQRKDKTIFPADTLISSFSEGDEWMVVYSLRDISRLKQVEIELRKALEKEKELNELKTNFTSIVSHEFRTPLSIILASSDSLIHYFDRLDGSQQIDKLRNINRQVQRLVQLMDDVLTITRSESVGFEFRPRNLDLVSLCNEIIEDVKIGYNHNISINFTSEGQCHSVIADEFLFSHILQNLCSNAVKYSKPEGIVHIDLNCSDTGLTLRVEDHGIGIPQEHQSKLFQAFHRAANVGQIQGTGIGMTIVKRAVDTHHGTIEFTSVEGQGTTFIVKLPLTANSG